MTNNDLRQQLNRIAAEMRHALARGDDARANVLEVLYQDAYYRLLKIEAVEQAEQIVAECQDSHS